MSALYFFILSIFCVISTYHLSFSLTLVVRCLWNQLPHFFHHHHDLTLFYDILIFEPPWDCDT